MAYCVFEDFQLADYGNRIPSLSFEVFADDGDISIGAILIDLVPQGLTANCPTLFGGFAATGDSVRGVAETVATAIPIHVVDRGDTLVISESGSGGRAVSTRDLGAAVKGQSAARLHLDRRSESTIADLRAIAYSDPARDYQAGLQRVRRGSGSRREERIDLAATLSPAQARAIAETGLAHHWISRTKLSITLPWRYANVAPGELMMIPEVAGTWRVTAARFEAMTVKLDLERQRSAATIVTGGNSGRTVSETDVVHGPTSLQLIDLPQLDDSLAVAPRVAVAASGASPGWRRAALLSSIDQGASWQEAGDTAAPAVLGLTTGVLAPGTAQLIDAVGAVDVHLLHPGTALTNADDDGLLAGRNLAMVGEEMIQFGSAVELSPGNYRLSRLLRGRRGSEWAMTSHSAGERFVLIEEDALAAINVPSGTAGVRVLASGVGDLTGAVEAILTNPGAALRPPSPCGLTLNRDPANGWTISWIRRSRAGWRWTDFVDAPLAEEQELYIVTVTPSVGTVRSFEVTLPAWTYSDADRAADVAAGAASVAVVVVQRGTKLPSYPSSITFPII
jgi:hypothetical protein